MNLLLALITWVVVLAVFQTVLAVLLVALVLALLFLFATRPRETLVLLGAVALIGLTGAQPVAAIVALGVIAVAVVLAGPRRESKGQALLPDGREHR